MTKLFEHDYTVQSESTPTEKVKCMRCGEMVQETGYREFKNPSNKSKSIHAIYQKPLSNLRQVPFLVELAKGRLTIVYLQLCIDCEKFDFDASDGPKIIRQIKQAEKISLLWAHYPPDIQDDVDKKWGDAKILRRLSTKEAENHHLKRGQ